jgi:hypothetical protein
MTEDIYAQIEKKKNKQKKVAARSQDGFTVTAEGGNVEALALKARERMTQNSADSTSSDISPSELTNNTQEHLPPNSRAIIEGDRVFRDASLNTKSVNSCIDSVATQSLSIVGIIYRHK